MLLLLLLLVSLLSWQNVVFRQTGLCGKATGLVSTPSGLYEIGTSFGRADFLSEVFFYTPASDSWENNVRAAPTERAGYGVAAVGNLVYSIGGMDANHTHNYGLNEQYNANLAPPAQASSLNLMITGRFFSFDLVNFLQWYRCTR